jgi:DNA-binding transcriptional regulator YiaG
MALIAMLWSAIMGRQTVTKENFWSRVRKGAPDECWNWTGPISYSRNGGMGYGRIDAFGTRGVYVHRVAYWLANPGVIDLPRGNGLLVRHKCDNPICCNPSHLELGTHADNMHDMVSRGRKALYANSTETPRAKLDASEVILIRQYKQRGTMTREQLAREFNVSVSTIKGVWSGRHYGDVV